MKNIFTTLFSILLIFVVIEVLLRITGNDVRIDNLTRSADPIIYKDDEILGWEQKKGEYFFQPWSNEGKITKFTINENGSRKTEFESTSKNKIFFFGGSLTQGWAVDDSENFVNIFQNLNKDFKTFNYGVGAYGGYQSLLLQEKILKNYTNISHIIYGYIDHHEIRNVAAGSWLYLLNEYSKRGHVWVPFGSIEDGALKRNKPVNYIKLPLSNYSALIAKVEKKIMKLKSAKRERKKFEISKLIILEMSKNAIKYNSNFTVLLLDINTENLKKYSNFFNMQNINYIYCPFPEDESVKNEGHPNFVGHTNVANCLNNKIKNLLIE